MFTLVGPAGTAQASCAFSPSRKNIHRADAAFVGCGGPIRREASVPLLRSPGQGAQGWGTDPRLQGTSQESAPNSALRCGGHSCGHGRFAPTATTLVRGSYGANAALVRWWAEGVGIVGAPGVPVGGAGGQVPLWTLKWEWPSLSPGELLLPRHPLAPRHLQQEPPARPCPPSSSTDPAGAA